MTSVKLLIKSKFVTIYIGEKMGNICTNHEEKIIQLENKVEEQNQHIEKLYQQNKLLRRNNKYLENRYKQIYFNRNVLD